MYGLVGESVTVEVGFEIFYAQTVLSVTHSSLLLPRDQDIEFWTLPAPCLSGYCHVYHCDENELDL